MTSTKSISRVCSVKNWCRLTVARWFGVTFLVGSIVHCLAPKHYAFPKSDDIETIFVSASSTRYGGPFTKTVNFWTPLRKELYSCRAESPDAILNNNHFETTIVINTRNGTQHLVTIMINIDTHNAFILAGSTDCVFACYKLTDTEAVENLLRLLQ